MIMTDPTADLSEGTRFLKFLYKWRKILIIAIAIAALASVIVTLLMKSEYESTGIIFATPTNSPEKILVEPQFGYDVDADWLMQVLKSDIVKDTLVKLFGLVDYFGLDTNKQDWHDELNKKYKKTIKFERTRYMSIEITASTRNPELSTSLVNTVIDKIDGIREKIFKENTRRALLHYENAFFEKMHLVNHLVDSIYGLRNENTSQSLNLLHNQIMEKQGELEADRDKLNTLRNDYNFYDLSQYIEILNENLAKAQSEYATEKGKYEIYIQTLDKNDTLVINAKARMEGARQNMVQFGSELTKLDDIKSVYGTFEDRLLAEVKQINQLKEQYENTLNAFEPYVNSIRLERLKSDYEHEQVLLNDLRYRYENALLNYRNPIPAVYVINRATPLYERTSPSFIENGLIIILATLAFVIGFLLLREKYISLKPVFHDNEL
jgi:uncharacterized protein involved in exopolysaccharide biosynthesis